ncbi:MAG: hypothetical protein JWO59_1440, partial [Chloroflexi bacterium]|nr:hypothetical protein [Chloroflexota bacterium]
MPGELVVRCLDLDDPGGFFRSYRSRLTAGYRFVYGDPRLGDADSFSALAVRIREMDAPPEFLELIAHDADPRIRAAAAGNANLSVAVLLSLAGDPSAGVRRAAAAHPWAPAAMLRALARDDDDSVLEQVAVHLATPP